jgi:acid phosphatase type 7
MENKSSSELTMGLQAQYLTSNPGYMGYKNAGCGKRDASGSCQARTCAATLTFHVVNFRTNVEFALFSGGFRTPCLLKRSGALQFTNPAKPLYGHLSSRLRGYISEDNFPRRLTVSSFFLFLQIHHLGFFCLSQMRLTWVSGDGKPQQVQYGGGKSAASHVATFTQKDMCSE